jgi:glycosyltransferase involved in cell wall biosynthesis
VIPSTYARFVHTPFTPWRRPPVQALGGRTTLWHTLWSETYSNPRYAELVPRLPRLFFAPIRQRHGPLGRVDGALARRTEFVQRRTLAWYHQHGLRLLLTPDPRQARLFPGSVVVDLDDPQHTPGEEAALRVPNIRHAVVTTQLIADYVQASRPSLDVTVIPQGVDLERARRARSGDVRRRLLSRLDLPIDTVIVGYHAPFICVSGDGSVEETGIRTFQIDVLLEAVQQLWADEVTFVLLLVGAPSDRLRRLAQHERRLLLSDYVDRDRLFDWVGCFDVGTYPRTVDFEGRESVKLLEYMACGAPIVAMDTSEAQVLEQASAGFVAGDRGEFRRQLRRLIEDQAGRCRLGERGRQFVTSRNWNSLAARYDAIVERIAETA